MDEQAGFSNKEIIDRLKRIEGQARGIQKMLEEGRDCEEVVVQLAALRAAVSKVCMAVVSSHMADCVLKPDADDDKREAVRRATGLMMKLGL
jgi:CsoR family transcriptional regulator, copper-sensing transcriptional repressor